MGRHGIGAAVLFLGAAMPALAERIVFEGSFSTYVECGIVGRFECTDPMTVEVPFRFTADVPSGVLRRSNATVEQSPLYGPPFLTPAMVTDGIIPSAESFGTLSDRQRRVSTDYSTTPVATGLRWDFDIVQSWSGVEDRDPLQVGIFAHERISLSLFGDLGRSAAQPPAFAELVQLFDQSMASRTDIDVSAMGLFSAGELGNPTGATELTKSLTGTFRIVAVQCRTPGLVGRVREALRG